MHPHIFKAIRQIENSESDNLDLECLAKKAGYSKFHFSRLFKILFGESVMEYAKRLRIERSVQKLIGSPNFSEIAYDSGFQTTAGYYKAFKKRFGSTPADYQKNKKEFWNSYLSKIKNEPCVITLTAKTVVYQRSIGSYESSIDDAWKTFTEKLHLLGQTLPDKTDIRLTEENCEFIGICHDDPTVTEPNRIRYDACIASGEKETTFLANQGFEVKTMAAGVYARIVHHDKNQDELESWFGLCGWIIDNGYTFGAEPPFERYINFRRVDQELTSDVEMYISIKDER